MKKIIAVLVSIIVVLIIAIFVILGLDKSKDEGNDKGNVKVNDTVEVDDSTSGLYEVEVLSYRLEENYGDPVILIKYKFTNNSEEAIAFDAASDYKFRNFAYQNGVGLEISGGAGIKDFDYEDKEKKIKPGVSYELEICYALNDTTSDVLIEVEMADGGKVSKTFSIS